MNRLMFLKNRRQWKSGIRSCLITFSVLFLVHANFGILINRTESLPQKVFLHLKNWPAQKGNYTIIKHPSYPFPLIKQIKGEGGDRLHYKEGELWLDDQKIGHLYTINSRGEKLTPIAAQIIPQDFIFLWATHPKSFDSRYEEMGLILKRTLQGRAVPLW